MGTGVGVYEVYIEEIAPDAYLTEGIGSGTGGGRGTRYKCRYTTSADVKYRY